MDEHSLPTPALIVDERTLRRNLKRMDEYTRAHKLALRPHTKTHKAVRFGRMQLEYGSVGLTVAKAGEAKLFAQTGADVLLAYPTVDPHRCELAAKLGREVNLRVALDSEGAAQRLSAAAKAAGSTIGILVDLDLGMKRTGVANAADALKLAQHIATLPNLRVDGLFFYPGHIPARSEKKMDMLRAVNDRLAENLDLWKKHGLEARIVSGGSTPTAFDSHLISNQNEIRPGTYIFYDMNCVTGGIAALEDCAARFTCTVISTTVPGQVVLDAGSKTFSSDGCGPSPEAGYGRIVEYPDARVFKLTEEHAQADIKASSKVPKLGERVTVIPNHICPCFNLQDQVWLRTESGGLEPVAIEARGKLQ